MLSSPNVPRKRSLRALVTALAADKWTAHRSDSDEEKGDPSSGVNSLLPRLRRLVSRQGVQTWRLINPSLIVTLPRVYQRLSRATNSAPSFASSPYAPTTSSTQTTRKDMRHKRTICAAVT